MPAGDRTGPLGEGPMTGRGAGGCAGYQVPGYANPNPGFDLGLGCGRRGGSRGWRHWYHATGVPGWARFGRAPAWGVPPAGAYGPYAAPPTREQEAEVLKSQAEGLRRQLDAISQRIAELEQGQ
jgi:hypothetical protein